MNIQDALLETFATNFVAYYKAHAAHANVVGRNFYSDHKLLENVYEDLQEQIDTLGEFLRTVKAPFPSSLSGVITESRVYDMPFTSDLLETVCEDLETLVENYTQLYEVAGNKNIDISNYAQDRIAALNKFIWMLESTTGDRDD